MTHPQQILEAINNNNLFEAKNAIHNILMHKLAEALEQKLIDFAPSVFNEALSAKQRKNMDTDKDEDIDSKDLATLRSKKRKKPMSEEWTDSISNGNALAQALDTYQQTGQMPPELANFYNQNPPMGATKKKKQYGQSTIMAGYEPDEEIDSLVEAFEEELKEIIEEIQDKTGDQLTEEEIQEVAREYLELLDEMGSEELDQ